MTSWTLYELLLKTEGEIDPIAEHYTDTKRFRNLREWIELNERLISKLCDVADRGDLMCYTSAEKIITKTRDYLTELYYGLGDYVKLWEEENKCKSCQNGDMVNNLCLIDNKPCYRNKKRIHEECNCYKKGIWCPQENKE